jgi:Metallo-peptidase family M12B Reprolysin-like
MKHLFKSFLPLLLLFSTLNSKAQVPVLSSYPSAPSVIFLDFDGQSVPAGAWSASPIYCGASGLSTAQVTEAFNRVAEDYRPFNINITTDSTKYSAAPIAQRMRVIVTVTSAWYGSGAGGVAYVGSFIWGDDSPCFVFSALLGYNTKNIAEACAHEAGHTLGLYHQSSYNVSCVKTSDYNWGQGTGEIGWAPIMGAGYNQNLTLWNNGPNSYGCNVLQNDLDIITVGNGFTYRNDDYAATFAGATDAPFVSNQFNLNGVVERNTDMDMFKFTMAAYGRFQLSAVPYNVGTGDAGSDIDIQVTLYNNSQTQLNIYNPGTLLNSAIDTMLNPGNYYLKVEGKGNIYAPAYASLGSYSLQGNFTSGTLPLRRLELHGVLNNDEHQLSWLIDADEQVTKQVLEISYDGRNFSPITEPLNTSRAFSYRPNISAAVQYRLNVLFDNGRQFYSNVITLRKVGNFPRPRVVSNLITTNSVEISSPGVYNYTISDFSGKTLTQGTLANGSNIITTPGMTGGMYLVRFTNGTEQWIDKLVRQ